jgi:hypothetical protein
MSFFSRLFSAPDAVSKTVDAVVKTGDMLVFTEEEKSIANQKTLDWLLQFHEASSGSRLAQRYLSIMFSATFLMLVLLAGGFIAFGMKERGADIVALISETLSWPVGAIVAFYYGKSTLATIVKK